MQFGRAILFIRKVQITKWHIAHCHIKRAILKIGIFKTGYLNIGIGIKLFCNSSADGINLNTIDGCLSCYFRRHFSNEVANTAGRFKNITTCKAKLFKCFINTVNDRRSGEKTVENRFSCSFIFFRGQCIGQLGKLFAPLCIF